MLKARVTVAIEGQDKPAMSYEVALPIAENRIGDVSVAVKHALRKASVVQAPAKSEKTITEKDAPKPSA